MVHKGGALFLKDPTTDAEAIDFPSEPGSSSFGAALLADGTAFSKKSIQSFDQSIVVCFRLQEGPETTK
jgi:hypothetical protein